MPGGHEVVVRFHAPPAALVVAESGAALPSGPPVPPSAPAVPRPPVPPVAAPSPEPVAPPPPAVPDPREAEFERRVREERSAIRGVLDALSAAARRVAEEDGARVAELRRAAVELAVTIATRLVHDRVAAGEFAVEAVVREAAELLGPRGPFTVRLHPDDLALLESRLGGATVFAGDAEVRLVADPAPGRGGCRVEAPGGAVAARLGEQLAAVRRELLRSLGDAEPAGA